MASLNEAKEKLRALDKRSRQVHTVSACKKKLFSLEKERRLPAIAQEIDHFEFQSVFKAFNSWFVEIELRDRPLSYTPLLNTLFKHKF